MAFNPYYGYTPQYGKTPYYMQQLMAPQYQPQTNDYMQNTQPTYQKPITLQGKSVDNIEVAYRLSHKYNIEMPIVNAVYNVLYNGLDPKEAVETLMTRDLKEE